MSLFAVAADHLYEYYVDHYSTIPTIGTLFLLNGIGATVLGLILLVPLHAVLPPPAARRALALSAVGGFLLAALTLTGLFVSESQPLFGFMDAGYRSIIVVAIVSEAFAMVVLAPVALLSWRGNHVPPRLRRPELVRTH